MKFSEATSSLLSKKYYIWGTGRYSENLMRVIDEYNCYYRILGIELYDLIDGFVDSSVTAIGKVYHGKKILSPNELKNSPDSMCIIALVDDGTVEKSLDEKKISHTDHVDFIERIRHGIVCCIDDLLRNSNDSLNAEKYNFLMIAGELGKACDSNLLNAIEKLQKRYSIEEIVAAASWFYGDDIKKLSLAYKDVSVRKKEIVTLGIMADRLYGGGIEIVLQLLIRLFSESGIKIVLITDEINNEKENTLPADIIRHNMSAKYNMACIDRVTELGKCVAKYGIDAVCFHFGYNRLSTFYEMLYLKMRGIPVLMEVHSGYDAVLKDKRHKEKIPLMYGIADRIITLSNTDKKLWKEHGCRAEYIQNPVNTDILPLRHDCTNTVLWVGRIVQVPKQVFDVVPIIKEARKSIPGIKCLIVGSRDKRYDYDKLMSLIEENDLSANIDVLDYSNNIQEYYRKADVVLMTSSNESYSNVIQESKQYGIPLVNYDLPWLELLKEKKGYISVSQNDHNAAAKAIVDILSDEGLRNRLADEAAESVRPFVKHDVIGDWKRVLKECTDG